MPFFPPSFLELQAAKQFIRRPPGVKHFRNCSLSRTNPATVCPVIFAFHGKIAPPPLSSHAFKIGKFFRVALALPANYLKSCNKGLGSCVIVQQIFQKMRACSQSYSPSFLPGGGNCHFFFSCDTCRKYQVGQHEAL